MRAAIKSIKMCGFKGCKDDAVYVFDGKNGTIAGKNGIGKTTIASAYYWVFADVDAELKSNPMIRRIGSEELTPRVDIVLDIDGREISVAKIQKRSVKKSKDGKESVSLSNTYEVNAVEYGERDFKAKLAEYGFDTSLFLALAHPDVFTSQKSADMRKVLFSMASSKTDYEIASMTTGAEKATEMLKNYSVDEVRAMQNATIRKIKEVYGNKGEILRATIEGMERSKNDIDVAEVELQINAINEQISDVKAKQDDVSKQYEEYQNMSSAIMELKFAQADIIRKANDELLEKRRALKGEISRKNNDLISADDNINRIEREIRKLETTLEVNTKERETLVNQWKSVKSEAFDESTTICPTCHRELPPDEIEELKNTFEKSKAERLADIERKGTEAKANISKAKEIIDKLQGDIKTHTTSRDEIINDLANLDKRLSELPVSGDVSENEELKNINARISEMEQALSKMNNADDIRSKLNSEMNNLQSQLMACKEKLALSANNERIDEQINDLKAKQREYEQSKANAEEILYELDLIGRRRNELLSNDINSHFKMVDFKLFDYQKNGEYKEVCVPQYKGKDMRVSTNTGLEMAMKLDIIEGLQKFYGLYFPVFLDKAESLSDETLKQIDMPCQLIMLKVTEGNELKVEVA